MSRSTRRRRPTWRTGPQHRLPGAVDPQRHRRQCAAEGTIREHVPRRHPPVNVGVTNSGDFLGGTAITFSDVLGDQSFSLYAYSISQYRTLSASYLNLSGRLQFALQGFSQDSFFYGTNGFFSPALAFLSRDQAIAVRTVRGGSAFRHLSVRPIPADRAVWRPLLLQRAVSTTRCWHGRPTGSSRSGSAPNCFGTGPRCRWRRPSSRKRRCSASSVDRRQHHADRL